MITSVLRNIFRTNLDGKKTERCLIFTDNVSPEAHIGFSECERISKLKCIAFLASEIGKEYAREMIFHEFPSTGTHGAEPPSELWEIAFGKAAVSEMKKGRIIGPILKKSAREVDLERARVIIKKYKKDAVDAVIALSNYSTSHTRFRDFLTDVCGTRYASMPLFETSMLEGPMNLDWRELAKTTTALAAKVKKAEHIQITAPNGTKISFSIRGRKVLADTGILSKSGSFGNLPAGEVFLAPVEGTAEGNLVLDWAPTRELKSPVVLTVSGGIVTDVNGQEEYVALLEKKLSEREENRNIAELGIGTNARAKRPDNILESEKIMGTIHIALGDNSSFGGKVTTPFHQDFVFFKPTVILVHKDKSKSVLMKNGKFV